jgi:hypothetical protein
MPSLESREEPLCPRSDALLRSLDDDERSLDALRLELLEPDEALRPSLRSLELEELDEPFVEALRPPWPERSCELPRPELVLPDAPRPSLRLSLSERSVFDALYPDSFDEDDSSLRVEELPMPSSP